MFYNMLIPIFRIICCSTSINKSSRFQIIVQFTVFSIQSLSIRYNGIDSLVTLKMVSFMESIVTLLIVNKKHLQHSLTLGNCRDSYYADVDSNAFELL